MNNAKFVDRTREVKMAQAFAVAFAALYYLVWAVAVTPRHRPPPLCDYAWSLMFFALVCLIPSMFPKEGRDARRTDKVLGLMFLFELIFRVAWTPRLFAFAVRYLINTSLAVFVAVSCAMLVLNACIVGCFFTHRGPLKWVLPLYIASRNFVPFYLLFGFPVHHNQARHLELAQRAIEGKSACIRVNPRSQKLVFV